MEPLSQSPGSEPVSRSIPLLYNPRRAFYVTSSDESAAFDDPLLLTGTVGEIVKQNHSQVKHEYVVPETVL
ncbi:unnamed protein product [Fusarium graminearum]|nr:unnamed protein product [Fusarium graminearum]